MSKETHHSRSGPRARKLRGRFLPRLFSGAFALLLLLPLAASADGATPSARRARRLVVVKVDGLSHGLLDRFVRERDTRTGKSLLPRIEHVFYRGGTRVSNFYVRGTSLSGPSWSMLDTGQHLQVKGNVEFDRFTLHSYDYLNFIPFWIENVARRRVDMPGAELLDELGLPLLFDAYPYDERFLSFQLYQRGTRWTTLQRGLQNRFTSRAPAELFGEWMAGFEARDILSEQMERELTEKLQDPRVRYLDFYSTDFDHAVHHNRDRETHLHALQELDALIGRLWAAIQKTPLAPDTVLVLVSDHGVNTSERVYSQGFNLVKLLGSATGGGHHVVTKRRLLNDYAIKGLYPLVPLIHTTTQESFYLKGRSTQYPTALVDFDGNERASVHLRDSDLNLLHVLLQQLQRRDLGPDLRRAATEAFFATLGRRRAGWRREHAELTEEVAALSRLIARREASLGKQPKWTQADRDAGRDQAWLRLAAQADSWRIDERKYAQYLATLSNLLSLRREGFAPERLKISELIAPGAMGEANTVHELQNYVVGPAPGGLALAPGKSLDLARSFARVDYFRLLREASVRNNVQPNVSNRPVDFVATRLPREQVAGALGEDESAEQVVWLYAGAEAQALLLSRTDEAGRLWLRYLPAARLTQDEAGRVSFERAAWAPGLPLKIWEDTHLDLPAGADRAAWLGAWHTDLEWLRALHRTTYSNGLVGLHEQLARHTIPATDADEPGLSEDERLIRRFRRRQRALVEADLLVLANNHWNFDVRGFNPGGNHGSFFRASTHSTLMLAGGERTGVPRGLSVEEPYDSLSYAPTLLALTGQIETNNRPVPALWQRGFRTLPGRVISELFAPPDPSPFAERGAPESRR